LTWGGDRDHTARCNSQRSAIHGTTCPGGLLGDDIWGGCRDRLFVNSAADRSTGDAVAFGQRWAGEAVMPVDQPVGILTGQTEHRFGAMEVNDERSVTGQTFKHLQVVRKGLIPVLLLCHQFLVCALSGKEDAVRS